MNSRIAWRAECSVSAATDGALHNVAEHEDLLVGVGGAAGRAVHVHVDLLRREPGDVAALVGVLALDDLDVVALGQLHAGLRTDRYCRRRRRRRRR